jgi:SsrA-binding protein
MAKPKTAVAARDPVIARNRKARYDYDITETFEAGVALTGSEVKSLRKGRASLADAYARIRKGEVFLEQLHIPPYEEASYANHEPLRSRKLLVHRAQIRELTVALEAKGFTLVPLKLYFKGNHVKVELGLAKGRKKHDKRHAIAEREAKRDMDRNLAARRR